MPRRENKNMPRVESGWLYADMGSVAVGGVEWLTWLQGHTAFYFESPVGTFTARRELRSGSWYWYAYRKRQGKLSKRYMGKSEELTSSQLENTAELLDQSSKE